MRFAPNCMRQCACGNHPVIYICGCPADRASSAIFDHSKVMAGSLVTFKAKLDHHLRNVMWFV